MQRLQKAKSKLESAEKEKIVLETQIEGLEEDLKRLGYDDMDSASSAIDKMEKEISTLEDTLGEMLNDFEHNYAALLAD